MVAEMNTNKQQYNKNPDWSIYPNVLLRLKWESNHNPKFYNQQSQVKQNSQNTNEIKGAVIEDHFSSMR